MASSVSSSSNSVMAAVARAYSSGSSSVHSPSLMQSGATQAIRLAAKVASKGATDTHALTVYAGSSVPTKSELERLARLQAFQPARDVRNVSAAAHEAAAVVSAVSERRSFASQEAVQSAKSGNLSALVTIPAPASSHGYSSSLDFYASYPVTVGKIRSLMPRVFSGLHGKKFQEAFIQIPVPWTKVTRVIVSLLIRECVHLTIKDINEPRKRPRRPTEILLRLRPIHGVAPDPYYLFGEIRALMRKNKITGAVAAKATDQVMKNLSSEELHAITDIAAMSFVPNGKRTLMLKRIPIAQLQLDKQYWASFTTHYPLTVETLQRAMKKIHDKEHHELKEKLRQLRRFDTTHVQTYILPFMLECWFETRHECTPLPEIFALIPPASGIPYECALQESGMSKHNSCDILCRISTLTPGEIDAVGTLAFAYFTGSKDRLNPRFPIPLRSLLHVRMLTDEYKI